MFVVAAMVFGYFRSLANQRSREMALIEQAQKLGFAVSQRYWGPLWLTRLVSEQNLSILRCASTISSFGPVRSAFDKEPWDFDVNVFDVLGQLRNATRFALFGNVCLDDAHWARLAKMANLEELYFEAAPTSDAALACLAKLPKLRLLRIANLEEKDRVRLQKALPKCEIVSNSDDRPAGGP